MVNNLPDNPGDARYADFIPGWEDPLEEGNHSSILIWRIPWTEDPGGATVHGVAESGMTQHI